MKTALVLAVLAAATGCAQFTYTGAYKTTVLDDKFEGTHLVAQDPVLVGDNSRKGFYSPDANGCKPEMAEYTAEGPMIAAGLTQMTDKTGSSLELEFRLEYTDWVFLNGGCTLLLDGKRMDLKANAPAIRDNGIDPTYGVRVTETEYFPLTLDQAKAIATATLVEFKITADKTGYQTGCFPDRVQNGMRRFLAEECGVEGLTYTTDSDTTPAPAPQKK